MQEKVTPSEKFYIVQRQLGVSENDAMFGVEYCGGKIEKDRIPVLEKIVAELQDE